MSDPRNVLLIDNDLVHAEDFFAALLTAKEGPFRTEWFRTLAEAIERLRENNIWAIFANLSLPDSQGPDTFDRIQQVAPRIPTLILAGADDEAIATEALRHGAKDYLLEGHIGAYSFGPAVHNLGEREEAEEALLAEKERAHVTLSSIGDGVLAAAASGNVTYLNAVAEEMTGWSS